MSGGIHSLKSTPNDRFLRNFSILFTLRDVTRNLLRGSHLEIVLYTQSL